MTATSPFIEASGDDVDSADIVQAANGDSTALNRLIRRHHGWIYALALRMTMIPQDAEDIAQEALLKIVTRLAQFEGRARFRTWAYRIVVNTILNARRSEAERDIKGFDAYGTNLDSLPSQSLNLTPQLEPDRSVIVEEAKISCMLGMLMCLTREQRMAYVLAEMFEAPSDVAAELMGVSPAAFRKRLERARRDLHAFMNDKCGLLKATNPCRCARKTTAFIEAGYVDPGSRQFTGTRVEETTRRAHTASADLDGLMETDYPALFRAHPFPPPPDLSQILADLMQTRRVREIFDLDNDGDGPPGR